MPTTTAFEEAYSKLNTEQKRAVDTVDGPVMVLAGPGTGKTSILTLRVANILLKTGAKPDEILVLTFTDSAARTVAKRLEALIGEEAARKANVFTFHSFADEVLKRHPEAFPDYADRRQMGEVEHVLLWRDVLEQHPSALLQTPRSLFHYLKDLKQLEDNMVRECFSLEAYAAWLNEEAKRIEDDPSLRYVRATKDKAVGDLKPEGEQKRARLEKGREAARLIEAYRREKDARGLYGFTDVLRIVVDALGRDEALRADVQEQYQYVLADEHQDANALQHAMLDALAFDDHPNLFVVGDEKQAIFGFQGADTTHFGEFLERYPRTSTIALSENFRSYQEVLDLSHRLLAELPSSAGAHVELTAARGAGAKIRMLAAEDPLAERDEVATLVEEAIAEGVLPHEIAVITLKNKTAELFATHLRARGIPTLRAGDVDLEGRPVVRVLLALMRAVADPIDSASLRDALLAPWWEAPLAERALFLCLTGRREFEAELAQRFPAIAELVETLRAQALEMPPLSLLSVLLAKSGARGYLLAHPEALEEDVPLVRRLVMYVEELVAREPNASFANVMEAFDKAREHEVGSIKASVTQREGFVTVITAHKAKGMEFQRVFVSALTKSEWEGRGKSALLPSPFDYTREREELVRIFYVALTRAKDELVLSRALSNGEGRDQAPISLLPSGLELVTVESDPLPLLHSAVEAPALIRELTMRYLAHDGISPSAYNEYLESPPTFFAKRVLRLSEPETRAIAVGNAVHAGVAEYLRLGVDVADRADAARAALARSFLRSLLPRGDAFDALVTHGGDLLEQALADSFFDAEALAVEETFAVSKKVAGVEVKLKGKLDALVRLPEGECIIDFKTTRNLTKEEKEKFGRQIAFYDLLLRGNGHEPVSGRIVQLTEEGLDEHAVVLTDTMRDELFATLEEVLSELLSGHWREGAPSDYDALLALFAEPVAAKTPSPRFLKPDRSAA